MDQKQWKKLLHENTLISEADDKGNVIAVALKNGDYYPLSKPTTFQSALKFIKGEFDYTKKNMKELKYHTWDGYNIITLETYRNIPKGNKPQNTLDW